jgi:lysophospholipase L1-like esterase
MSTRKIVLIAVGSFLCAELATRAIERIVLKHPIGILTDYILMRPDHWALQPNIAITQIERAGDTDYEINDKGYRGAFPETERAERRVLFLGDSITFALGVDNADSFAKVIESSLAAAGKPVEVANLAMFSYGPHEYLDTWRRLGPTLKPNVVVLQLYLNDFDAPPWTAPTSIDAFTLMDALSFRIINLSAFARRVHQAAHMAFYYLARPILRDFYPNGINDAEPRHLLATLNSGQPFEAMRAIPEAHALLREIKESGARVLLFYSPHESQLFKTDYDSIDATVERAFAAEANSYIAMLPRLRAARDKKRIFRDGLHYAAFGHKVVASALLPAIEALLDSTETPRARDGSAVPGGPDAKRL